MLSEKDLEALDHELLKLNLELDEMLREDLNNPLFAHFLEDHTEEKADSDGSGS